MKFYLSLLLLLCVAACDDLPDWMGDKEKPKLAGTRIDVLAENNDIKPDNTIAQLAVSVPELKANENWRQAGGSPQGMTGNLQLASIANHDRTRIGDGNGWTQPLYSLPIIAGDTLYAMDAKGYITAHETLHIDKVKWTNKSAVTADEADILGGGLAFDNGKLYVATGRGNAIALEAATGKELWKINLTIPLRAAPKVSNGKVYYISVDNQTFALDAEKGTQVWNQRGINESAGFISSISPAVNDAVLIVPYSSGEIHAIDTLSGQDIWTELLLHNNHISATSRFTGIGGNPIIYEDVVYVTGTNKFTAAFALTSGRRLWVQDISSLNTPWVAGDFVYVLSTDSQLVCLTRSEGKIKWVRQLPAFEDEEKHKKPYLWYGPVMADGKLIVAGLHGKLLQINSSNGATLSETEIPEHIIHPPIVAGNRLYFITKDARLYVFY